MSKAGDTYGKHAKEMMEDILRKLEEMRSDANIMDKERVQKEKDKGSGSVSGTRGHLTNQPRQPRLPYQEPPPSTNKECRVCKQLEKQSCHSNLFLNHRGPDTHGCPKFVGMTQRERLSMATEIKLCQSCISCNVIAL